MQTLRARVAPASFCHKRIPNLDFLVARLATSFECPVEQFLVASALERFRLERLVRDSQKAAATRVESSMRRRTPHRLPAFRQFACRVQTNLVEHAPEINQTFHLRR